MPLVTVTDKFVAGWMGDLINFGGVVSAFGASLACAVGASRILFALGRDAGPVSCAGPAAGRGAPAGALIWVGVGSLLTLLLFIHEPLATRAVALSLTYGSDLIIVAYILVVIAAIIFTIRRRMAPVKTVILLVGLAVLGYVVKATFVPFPAPPYSWDALAAAITLVAGIVLPFMCPPLRRGSANRPCSKPGQRPARRIGVPQLTTDLAAVSGRDQPPVPHGHTPSTDSFPVPYAADGGLGGRPLPSRNLHRHRSRPMVFVQDEPNDVRRSASATASS